MVSVNIRGDVLGVDERLRAVSSGYRDNAVDGLEEGFAEVLHEPSGTQAGMGHDAATDEVELDGSQGDLRRGLVHAIAAQIRDVTHASGLRKIEEGRYLVSEVHSHDRRDQVEAIDPLHGGPMSRCVVPVEVDIGAVACSGTDAET